MFEQQPPLLNNFQLMTYHLINHLRKYIQLLVDRRREHPISHRLLNPPRCYLPQLFVSPGHEERDEL